MHMFRYLDVYINLWFDYMRLKCHLLDTFANGICLYVDERAPRAAAAWLRIVSFSYWIGSDWIDWSSDCTKHKNEKRTREREKNLKRTWGQRTQIVTFQWALLNVLHFNTFRLAPSRGVLCTVPHLGQRVWFQHSKNHKPKNKKSKTENRKTNYTHFNWAQAKQSMNTIHIHILSSFLFLLENFCFSLFIASRIA